MKLTLLLSKASLITLLLLNTCFAAVFFDETNDQIIVPHSAALDPVHVTVSAWVNAIAWDPSGQYDAIVTKGNTGSPFPSYYLRNEAGKLDMQIVVGGGNFDAAGTLPSAGEWHHVCGTYDGETVKVYSDGIELDSDGGPSGNLDASGQNLRIGEDGSASGRNFNGQITEVAVWSEALTLEEIKLLHSSRLKRIPLQIQPDNLLAYWPLDDHPNNETANSADGFIFKDISGNGHDGTVTECNAKAEEYLSYP